MPHSQYYSDQDPPSILDRLLAHPWVVVIGLFSLALGARILIAAAVGAPVSRALAEAPIHVSVTIAIAFILGGTVSLAGALWPVSRTRQLVVMTVEGTGLLGLSGGWLAYGAAVMLSGNIFGQATSWMAIAVGLAAVLRVIALWVSGRRILRRVDEIRAEE